MIIWSRWGILTVLFAMLGVGIGFALAPILNPGAGPSYKGDEIVLPFGFGMVIAALVMWFAVRFLVGTVIDRPQPVVIQRQLAEPPVDANGRTQTVEWAHAVDPETGQVVMFAAGVDVLLHSAAILAVPARRRRCVPADHRFRAALQRMT